MKNILINIRDFLFIQAIMATFLSVAFFAMWLIMCFIHGEWVHIYGATYRIFLVIGFILGIWIFVEYKKERNTPPYSMFDEFKGS